ncbi:MAG TPA: DUF2062 domain-containing protein [Gammaproteobacteria bacterium]|nr:DUF2062 domain-containing protein [Gammaproteobacteria bacterium]|tara:strand:+ start:427 stop:945 length:519 start_codon:yes stop_codon:yes gene_type:complete
MLKSRLKNYLPDPAKLRETKVLRPVAHLLDRSELWHVNKRSLSGAFFVGLFSAFVPAPSQMLLAALLAIFFRVNLPTSVALVWITNPITMPPMFYLAYSFGSWLLGSRLEVQSIELSLGWLLENLGNIGLPLMLGGTILGTIFGLIGYWSVRLIWLLDVRRRWRRRANKRRP